MHLPELRLPHLSSASAARAASDPSSSSSSSAAASTSTSHASHDQSSPATAASSSRTLGRRRRRSPPAADVKPARPLPTGFFGATRAWLEAGTKDAERSELRILRRMAYFRMPHEPDPDPTIHPVVARQYQLEVLPGISINAVELRRSRGPAASVGPNDDDETGEASVLAHGYGCGAMHFWRQLDTMAAITAETGDRTFILDWHGLGRSTRTNPKIFAPMRKMSEEDGVREAEAFFLDPLLAFFDRKRITKASLIGHSLGGYLVSAFAIRYPARTRSLMLLSPAGIPTHPALPTATPPPTPTMQSRRPSHPTDGEPTTAVSPSTAESPAEGSNRGGVDGERLQQALIRSASRNDSRAAGSRERHGSADNWDSPGAADKFEAAVQAGTVPDEDGVVNENPLTDDEDEDEDRKPQTFKGPLGNGKRMQALYAYMWEAGYSPLGFLRKAGPIGPLMLGKYSTARFGGLEPDEQTALNAYLSNITLLPGSGEYAVGILLRPGAFARFPIAERIDALGSTIPCQFVYGSEDWMDRHGGKDCVRALRKVGNRISEVAITPEAGHHLYIDNAEWMNDYLRRTLIPLSNGKVAPAKKQSSTNGVVSNGLPSPPPTPVDSTFPTPASTALNTPRVSVSHSPEVAKAALGPVIA